MNNGYIITNQIIPNTDPSLFVQVAEEVCPIVGFMVDPGSGCGIALIMTPTGNVGRVSDFPNARVWDSDEGRGDFRDALLED